MFLKKIQTSFLKISLAVVIVSKGLQNKNLIEDGCLFGLLRHVVC
jgi:hypothetical protein